MIQWINLLPLHCPSGPEQYRGLRRGSEGRRRAIVAGLVAPASVWCEGGLEENVGAALGDLEGDRRIDLGCALGQGSFEVRRGRVRVSTRGEALVFFVFRLLERLREMGPAPEADLMRYARGLESFRKK